MSDKKNTRENIYLTDCCCWNCKYLQNSFIWNEKVVVATQKMNYYYRARSLSFSNRNSHVRISRARALARTRVLQARREVLYSKERAHVSVCVLLSFFKSTQLIFYERKRYILLKPKDAAGSQGFWQQSHCFIFERSTRIIYSKYTRWVVLPRVFLFFLLVNTAMINLLFVLYLWIHRKIERERKVF